MMSELEPDATCFWLIVCFSLSEINWAPKNATRNKSTVDPKKRTGYECLVFSIVFCTGRLALNLVQAVGY